MTIIISKVLVIFIYIAIGFASYRLKIFNDESIQHLTKLIIFITCPALMVSSIGGAELDSSIMLNTVVMLILSFVIYAVIGVIAVWIARRIKGVDPLDANVHSFGMTTSNTGFMGFPISLSIFGPTVLYYMVIQNIGLNFFMYTLGIWQFNYKTGKHEGRKSIGNILKSIVNPILVAAAISAIILFTGIKIPEYCMNIFDTVGNVTIPLSMILVGIQLGGSHIASVIKSRDILITTVINLIVFPAIAFGIALILPLDNIARLSFALGMCFPSAAIGVAISAREGRNSLLYAEIVAATTLFSMVTLPIWIVIISNTFPI